MGKLNYNFLNYHVLNCCLVQSVFVLSCHKIYNKYVKIIDHHIVERKRFIVIKQKWKKIKCSICLINGSVNNKGF